MGIGLKILIVMIFFPWLLWSQIPVGIHKVQKPTPATNSTAPKACSAEDMKEAFNFLNDYLFCIAGNEDACHIVTSFAEKAAIPAGAVGLFSGSQYSASKLLSISDLVLGDPKKYARDSSYRSTIERQWGGADVDKFIEKNGKSPSDALKAAEKEIKTLSGKTDPASLKKIEELSDTAEKIKGRISLTSSNQTLLKKVIDETEKVNKVVVDQVREVDGRLAELDREYKSSSGDRKAKAKADIASAKEERAKTLSNFQSLDTQSKEAAEGFNKEVDRMIAQAKSNAGTSTEELKRLKDTISDLEKKKIKVPSGEGGKVSRYVMNISEDGYSLADINGEYKKLPDWAQEMRQSQIREFPEIIKRVANEDPEILKDTGRALDRMAELEHERYRIKTQKDLINTYEQRRRILTSIGEEVPDMEFQKLTEGPKAVRAELSIDQNKALQTLKKNWLEVDIPYSALSAENIDKTKGAVVKNLEYNLPTWTEEKGFTKFSRFFIPRAYLGKTLGYAMRVGTGWVGTGALVAFDYVSIRENLVLPAAFSSDTIKNNFWDKIAPQCRMPKEQVLGAPDTTKEVSKWFCKCEEEEQRADKMTEACQTAPSDMDSNTKQICQIARSAGRDRDLQMAKKYQELKGQDKKANEIFKSAAGCDIMKNYPDHCRWSTTELTDQGLYFMKLIEQNKLEKSVTELCPDVCDHWVSVATQKVKELKQLKQNSGLPKTKAENKTKSGCDMSGTEPPQNYEKWKSWKSCQKPISCQGNNKIILNLKDRGIENYELTYDADSRNVRSVRHVMGHIQNRLNERGNSYIDVETKKTFEYQFDPEGQVTRLNFFNFDTKNERSETVAVEDFIPRFHEAAFNANTARVMRNHSELAINRRIEAFLVSREAIKYCCQNEVKCGDGSEPQTGVSKTSNDRTSTGQK